jgi:hypothetical protein
MVPGLFSVNEQVVARLQRVDASERLGNRAKVSKNKLPINFFKFPPTGSDDPIEKFCSLDV